MTFQQFHVTDENPNDTTGGGGCICSPTKQPDCKPPYAVFFDNDMEDITSPHVVICAACANAASEQLVTELDFTDAEIVDDDGDLRI